MPQLSRKIPISYIAGGLLVLLFISVAINTYLLFKTSENNKLNSKLVELQEENNSLNKKITDLKMQIAQKQIEEKTPISSEEQEIRMEPTPVIAKPGNVTRALGYINSVYDKDGKRYLTIDYVQWLSEFDGTCSTAKVEDKPRCNPNGYQIVNNNPLLRTFEIDQNVEILVLDAALQEVDVEYRNFRGMFYPVYDVSNARFSKEGPPFHIEILNNKIIKITEQYIP